MNNCALRVVDVAGWRLPLTRGANRAVVPLSQKGEGGIVPVAEGLEQLGVAGHGDVSMAAASVGGTRPRAVIVGTVTIINDYKWE